MASYGKFEAKKDALDENGNLIDRHPITVEPRGKWRHWCGATVITRKHAITAAHCYKAGETSV